MTRVKGRAVLIGIGIAVAALVIAVLGYSIGNQNAGIRSDILAGGGVTSQGAPGDAALTYGTAEAPAPGSPQTDSKSFGAGVAADEAAVAPIAQDTLIIRNSAIEVRVKDVEEAVDEVRAAVTKAGAEIAEMSVSAGDQGPIPMDTGGATSVRGPATAYVTIRVAAEKLAALEREIGSLGVVVTQSSSASDVTEQAIDLEARLRNLRAEELRLRSFLTRTNKVSELLEVERELARVRGEIESMDAQLTYLERQAARATLTVTLSEPGPVVQPAGTTWGLREAVTRGIQATAALAATLVTVAIPLAIFGAVVLLVALPIRALIKRRTAKPRAASVSDDQPSNGDT